MAAPDNLSFEIGTGGLGHARSWVVTTSVTGGVGIAGYLESSNLARYSEELDQDNVAYWQYVNITILANQINAPNAEAAATVDRISETGANGEHYLFNGPIHDLNNVEGLTVVCRFKKGTAKFAGLGLIPNGGSIATAYARVVFDVEAGLIQVAAEFAVNVTGTARIIPIVGQPGWYLAILTARRNGTVNAQPAIIMSDGALYSYVGNTANNLFAWGAQILQAQSPGPYVHTVADGFIVNELGYENFERFWTANDLYQFALDSSTAAEYQAVTPPKFVENFEEHWNTNHSYLFTLGTNEAAFYNDGGGETYEDFEESWQSNDAYLFALPVRTFVPGDVNTGANTIEIVGHPYSSNDCVSITSDTLIPGPLVNGVFYFVIFVDANTIKLSATSGPGAEIDILGQGVGIHTILAYSAASFDAVLEQKEDFEESWQTNESYQFALGSATAATYENTGTPEAFEDFEETQAPVVISAVNTATDTFTATAHGRANGDKVRIGGGVLPLPIVPNNEYFIVGSTANTFQLAATAGGAVIDITSPGGGTNYLFADAEKFWTLFMSTV